MNFYSSFNRLLVPWGTALLLAGCSGWSGDPPMRGNALTEPFNLSAIREATAQAPTDFNQLLTMEYADLSTKLANDEHDMADADYFARKGEAAAKHDVVPPENNGNWLVPLEVPDGLRSHLAESRTRLVAALDGGGRDRSPALAARAQSRYDCWVERMEDNWKTAGDGPCHAEFTTALDELEKSLHPQQAAVEPPKPAVVEPSKPAVVAAPAVPLSGPSSARHEYRVYFEFAKATLPPGAQEILHQIAEKAGDAQVELVGKADRTGSDKYNMKLSRERADAVRSALVTIGVPPGNIEERWVGEREPPVPTPPGVREPRNRVAEIIIR